MSTWNIATILNSLESDVDDNGVPNINTVRKPSKFDRICDSLGKMIVSWKDGSVPVTNDQCQEALKIIEHIKEKHAELQSKTSALSEQIILIQSQLTAEVARRNKKEQDLQSQIDTLKASNVELKADTVELKADTVELKAAIVELTANVELKEARDESQRVLLVRALGTSFQYALTQKFPGLFTTRYPFACTFKEIDAKVTAKNDAQFNLTLANVKSFFLQRGIESDDINTLINIIRRIGICTTHMIEMVDTNGVAFKPTAADLHEVINKVNLPATFKDDARILLDALDSIVPTGNDLLYIV